MLSQICCFIASRAFRKGSPTYWRGGSMIKFAFAAVAVLTATPAFAADFKGARVEGRASYDRVSFVLLENGGPGNITARDSGVGYGVEAGYDAQVGTSLVLGIYAGIENATTKECVTEGSGRSCLRLGRNITGGARLGFALSPSMLFL